MATSSLLPAVQAALGAAVTLGYASTAADHDVYEAYVLTLFLEAAVAEDWNMELRDGSCRPTSRAVFRLGPGRLPTGDFTHVRLWKSGKQDLEAHLGVKVVGSSPVVASRRGRTAHLLHEFDLLVLPSSIADVCRAANMDPPRTAVVAQAEAKHYGGNLTLPIGRASVGMAVECGIAGKSVLVTNRLGKSVQDLVEHHGVTFRFLIKPSNRVGETLLVARFQELLRTAP